MNELEPNGVAPMDSKTVENGRNVRHKANDGPTYGQKLAADKSAVLIPDGVSKGNKEPLKYITREEFNNKNLAMTDQQRMDELDKRAILIKTPSGTYMPKNQIYRSTYAGDSTDPVQRDTDKKANFKALMGDLKLSDKPFDELNKERLSAAQKRIETPGGVRSAAFNLKHPEQAGQYTPDVLIKGKNDKFEAIWPGDKKEMKVLADATVKYGAENVMLKSTGNGYIPADVYDKHKGPLAAEKAFAKFAGTTLHLERKDMAPALYKVEEGLYVSKSKYAELLKSDKIGANMEKDLSKVDILLQAPSGKALVTPKTLKFLDKDGYAQTLKNEGLPETVKTRMDKTKPDVLVRISDDVVISGARARADTGGKSLDQIHASKNIYIQNNNVKGEPTGNYADMEAFLEKGSKSVANTRLVNAGVTLDAAAKRTVEAYSPDNIEKTMEKAAISRGLEERSRTAAGRGSAG